MPNVKHIKVNGVTYDIPVGSGASIAMVDALVYSTDHYTFNCSNITEGMYIIFKPVTTTPTAIDFYNGTKNYIEITNTANNTVYKLNVWGINYTKKVKIITTGCYIIAKYDTNATKEFNILGVFPFYQDSTFNVRSIPSLRKYTTEDTTIIPGVSIDDFAYIYNYASANDITVYDHNNNDITSNCTIYVASGINLKNTFISRVFIKTTSTVRVKSVILPTKKYGIPTDYAGGAYNSTNFTGFFVNEPTASLGEGKSKWTMSEYSYIGSTSTGNYHIFNCI